MLRIAGPPVALGSALDHVLGLPFKLASGLVFGAACPLVRNFPVIKQIVGKYGCSPEGQRLASLALSAYGIASLGPVAGPLVTQIGFAAAVACVCGTGTGAIDPNKLPPLPPVPWYKNPLVLAGLGTAAIGMTYYLVKKK